MWLIFACGSAFFAGVTAILAKIGIKNTNSNVATAIRTVVVLLFSWLLVWITGTYRELPTISTKTLGFLVLSGLATGASWLCYFKALQHGTVSQVTPVDKSSTVLTILLACLLLHEPMSLPKLCGVLTIASGTYLMLPPKDKSAKQAEQAGHSWLFYAALSAVFASLTAILGKVGITDISSNLGTAVRTIVVVVMAWVVVFVTHAQRNCKQIDGHSWLFLLLSGLTTGLSWLCYYQALQLGEASLVVPIDKLSILVTIACSRLLLKESLSKRACVGLLLLTGGTLCLCIPT